MAQNGAQAFGIARQPHQMARHVVSGVAGDGIECFVLRQTIASEAADVAAEGIVIWAI